MISGLVYSQRVCDLASVQTFVIQQKKTRQISLVQAVYLEPVGHIRQVKTAPTAKVDPSKLNIIEKNISVR